VTFLDSHGQGIDGSSCEVSINTIIKTTSVGDASSVGGGLARWPVILMHWRARRWRWAWSKWEWSIHATVSSSQEQTLSGRGARLYMGWLGVVTGISAASSWDVL